MLTGCSEHQQNRFFLMTFGLLNNMLDKPFRNIEMQTTRTLIDKKYLRFLRNHVGVNVISLSLSSFDSQENAKIIGMRNPINIEELCENIKLYDFKLRLSINLTDAIDNYFCAHEDITTEDDIDKLFNECKRLKADQITFRIMYRSGLNTPQDEWLNKHQIIEDFIPQIKQYILKHGKFLDILEYGAKRYSVKDMSTVLDDDCMAKEEKVKLKYLILREDCKLYTKWDDKGSILF